MPKDSTPKSASRNHASRACSNCRKVKQRCIPMNMEQCRRCFAAQQTCTWARIDMRCAIEKTKVKIIEDVLNLQQKFATSGCTPRQISSMLEEWPTDKLDALEQSQLSNLNNYIKRLDTALQDSRSEHSPAVVAPTSDVSSSQPSVSTMVDPVFGSPDTLAVGRDDVAFSTQKDYAIARQAVSQIHNRFKDVLQYEPQVNQGAPDPACFPRPTHDLAVDPFALLAVHSYTSQFTSQPAHSHSTKMGTPDTTMLSSQIYSAPFSRQEFVNSGAPVGQDIVHSYPQPLNNFPSWQPESSRDPNGNTAFFDSAF